MTTGDGLLQAVLEHPRDAVRRLVYADWLDEQAPPLGEVVRLQCAWRGLRRKVERAALEARENELLGGRDEVAPLRPLVKGRPLASLDTALLLFLHAAAAPARGGGGMPARSVWRGALQQTYLRGTVGHPTTLTVTARRGSRLKGVMRQNFKKQLGANVMGHFTLEGVFVCGRHLAFVTAKLRGPVMVPSLFRAELNGGSLEGTWRSPRWGGQGTFALSRGRG
jgi:uncharacterized protein (TIGR02996 family)